MKKNPYLIHAQVKVPAHDYAALLDGADSTPVITEVVAAMNRLAAERSRRVFGAPRHAMPRVQADGLVALTFEAYTEPAP